MVQNVLKQGQVYGTQDMYFQANLPRAFRDTHHSIEHNNRRAIDPLEHQYDGFMRLEISTLWDRIRVHREAPHWLWWIRAAHYVTVCQKLGDQ